MSKLSPAPSFQLLCLGYGAIAKALSAALPPAEWSVTGTTRNGATAALMKASGVAALDLATALDPSALADATHILISIPPDDQGDLAFGFVALRCAPRRNCTGWGISPPPVYMAICKDAGRLNGRRTAPLSTEGKRRARWRSGNGWNRTACPTQFRLPGLYGPGRSAFDRLRAGDARRIVKQGQVFSRAHEDDVAAALLASIQRPKTRAASTISATTNRRRHRP